MSSEIIEQKLNTSSNELIKKDFNELEIATAIAKAGSMIGNIYPIALNQMNVIECPKEIQNIRIDDVAWLYKLERLAFKKEERIEEKLSNIIKSIHLSDASCITLINCNEGELSYYIGVVNKTSSKGNLFTMKNVLESGIKGNFPGTKIDELDLHDVAEEIENIFENDFETQCITAISGAASSRKKDDNNKLYYRGIENMIDSLGNISFSLLMIADPISTEQLEEVRRGYEELGTQLSSLQKVSFAVQRGNTFSISKSESENYSKTISQNVSKTHSYSRTSGWAPGLFEGGEHHTEDVIGKVTGTVAMVASSFVDPVLGPAAFGVASSVFGGNRHESKTESGGENVSGGIADSEGRQKGETKGRAQSDSNTLTITHQNYSIKNLIKKIEEYLLQIEEYMTYGAFNCAAYVLSSSASTNALVANQYQSLMCGKDSTLQLAAINTWTNETSVKEIKEYLSKFTHPAFFYDNVEAKITPAVMVGSVDMPYHIAFPHRSITGLPVIEFEPFAQEVNRYELFKLTEEDRECINIGNLFHMGEVKNGVVDLDLKSLAMHTFVTGSTGSGKSNTIYVLLSKLMDKNVKFMVVEPAKGEYKEIFGGRLDVTVLGTNAKMGAMLKINPFSFPTKYIHVLEHLDRLVEIFNACWPMYAAMPAILKEAIERAYVSAGWNLETSTNKYSELLFPNFGDVLLQIREVVNSSDYSADNKGDYTGALVTRIASLTNGINGQIFSAQEVGADSLFDQNIIIDLSRVGSNETKSLIMGLLVIKMQEYRMAQHDAQINSNDKASDSDLKHVTVLEEAHNLLKHVNTDSGGESANLAGKAVEMLSNAIAEMRTYGEGFIIVDQAPALLDRSIIRNTNTKIIMRLPDFEDRTLVGKAASLSEKQIVELARLPKGVAAISQNDWMEPILCLVDHFRDEKRCKYVKESQGICMKDGIQESVIDILCYQSNMDLIDKQDRLLYIDKIVKSNLASFIKCKVIEYLNPDCKDRFKILSEIATRLYNSDEIVALFNNVQEISEWEKMAFENLKPEVDMNKYDLKDFQSVLSMILFEESLQQESNERLFERYMLYLDEKRREVK